MVFPFSNVLNSVIFLLHLVQKVKFLYSSNVKATLAQMSVLFLEGGGSCVEAKSRFFSDEKNADTVLRSVRFLASFISFYFEILSYLACGEKIIRLASKIARKWAKLN